MSIIKLNCHVSFEAANILNTLAKRNKQLKDFMTNDNCWEFFSFHMSRNLDNSYCISMKTQLFINARDMYELVKSILKQWVILDSDGTPCWTEQIWDGTVLYKSLNSPFNEG